METYAIMTHMYIKETKQSLKTKANREKIINAARKLMRERGFENSSIRDICKEANISIGSFYHLYESKEDLLNEVFDIPRFYFKGINDDPEHKNVYTIADAYINSYREMLSVLGFDYFCEVVFSPKKGNRLLFTKDHPATQFLVHSIEDYKKAGRIRNDVDSLILANVITSAAMGSLYHAMSTGSEESFYPFLKKLVYAILKDHSVE